MEEDKLPHSKLYIFLNFFIITASIVIIYIIYINSPNSLKSYEAPQSLEFAIIVFRHGSRSPILTFPSDTSDWPEGRKAITSARICKCDQDCGLITFENRLELFDHFIQLPSDEKNTYLAQCMEMIEPKRRKVPENVSRRQTTFKYSVNTSNNGRVKVCLKTLCNIHGVTPRKMQMLQNKMKNGDSNFSDARGKHKNRPHKIGIETRDLIRNHIMSFPKQESHYSRQKSAKECLSPDLSVIRMHSLFKEKYPNIKVSEFYYRQVFLDDFNLRFGVPRSDACATCDKNFVSLCAAKTKIDRDRILIESELHHRKAESGYAALKQDTEAAKVDPNLHVLCTDMQQVLFCPTLAHSNVFYQRQLSVYNSCIHDVGTNKATMHLWDETIARRGSNEISSVLLSYVLDNFVPLSLGQNRKLIVWSDRCIGQNNNWRMISLFQMLVNKNYFSSIDQKFLITGHSFMPCDRDFSLIERKKKTASAYIPFEWVEVISNARQTKPFEVKVMEQKDFKNFDTIEKQICRKNVKITESVWNQLTADDPTAMKMRSKHNILAMSKLISLSKIKRGTMVKVVDMEPTDLPTLYTETLPISNEKKKDLCEMSKFLPPGKGYEQFYSNIKSM